MSRFHRRAERVGTWALIVAIIAFLALLPFLGGCGGNGGKTPAHHHKLEAGADRTGPAVDEEAPGFWSNVGSFFLGMLPVVASVIVGYPVAKGVQRRMLPGLSAPPERKEENGE